MNYPTYYNSREKNLYSNYIDNYIDANSHKKYIKYQSNEVNVLKPNIIQNNNNISNDNINKNNLSFNNKNNFKHNNKKTDYLIYKSVLRDVDNNTSNISNNNILKNKDEYLYQSYNNKKDKYIYNIKIKNNRNDYNNYIPNNTNQKLLSQSINKYDSNKVNMSNINKYNALNKSLNKNKNTKKLEFYSSTDSFYNKNYYNKIKNKKNTKENINNYKDNNYNNIEIENEVNDVNNNNDVFMDKSEFFRNIKEIQDLDSIEIESSHIGIENNNTSTNLNDDIFTKENKKEKDILDEPINNNSHINRSSKNTLNKYNRTTNNIELKSDNINNLYSDKIQKNSSFNRVSLKNKSNKISKINNNILLSRINTEKKPKINFSKKTSDKIISNLTDNKRKNYLNNIDIHESFSNSNIKRENLNHLYNYEKEENNFDTSDNYYNHNEFLIHNKENNNNNNNISEKKFLEKLNISPYTKKRYSTLTNNELDENNINNDEENELLENKIINEANYHDLYNKYINTKKINNTLNNKIGFLTKEIHKKDLLIRRLHLENEANKKKIKKLINDNQVKINTINNLLSQVNNLKTQLMLPRNGEEKIINNSNRIYNDNKYIKEIKDLKDKLNNYEIENNRLKKFLLNNYKDKEIYNQLSKTKLKKTSGNCSEKNMINYREFNKSVSVSKMNNKINLDIPISKSYEEDKNIKSVDEKNINIKYLNKKI